MRARLLLTLLAAVAGCTAAGSTSPDPHAEHDAGTIAAMTAIEEATGMAFQPAGPHHELGTAPDGVELDLIGVPVEQAILSLPAEDPERGLVYLPHLRALLGGPDPVYEWVAAMLACRSDPGRSCETEMTQGNLEARFTDGGPDFVVVSLAREEP